LPGDGNRIALGWLDTLFADTTAAGGTTYYYAVRSVDSVSGAEDDNLVMLAVAPSSTCVLASDAILIDGFDSR
jgi:hypothetical protein